MIRLIAIGKVKDKNLQELCNNYLKKINNYQKMEIIEVNDSKIPFNASLKDEIKVMDEEAKRVLKQVKDEYVILLDLHGKMYDSIAFSQKLEKIQTYHNSNIIFIIGGSLGVSDLLIERSDMRLKLSEMTLLHQMTRLILLEQIYRSFKILNNETYHK